MTLPVWTTNPFTSLSMGEIEIEFAGNRQDVPINLSDYYSNSYTGYVTSDRVGYPFGIETPIPTIGNPIAISNFYGASSVSYTITTDRVSYDEGDVVIFSITAPLADDSVLYWTIEDATVKINLEPEVLPNGLRNIQYSPRQITATGGVEPYTFTIDYGSLPTGMSMAANGLITGRPVSIGTSLFAVTAADSDNNSGFKVYSVQVEPVTFELSPASLPSGLANVAYNATITGNSLYGVQPYRYTISSGFLPAGLILSNVGVISGTPTSVGSSSFTVKVEDANENFGTRQYVLQIQAVSITLNPSLLPNAKLNAFYSEAVSATGGIAPYTYELDVGALPTGLSIDPVTGIISGRPTQVGTFIFGIKATDFNFNYKVKDFEITVENVVMVVLPTTLPDATLNISYPVTTFAAQGGTAPYSFVIQQGTIPTGMTFDSGILSGKPTVAGTFVFKVRAIDADNNIKDIDITLNVNTISIQVSPTTIPDGSVGAPYVATFSAIGGTSPYTFTLFSGGLPTGLSLNNAAITGTPSAFGQWTFTIRATDLNGNFGSTQYTLNILPAGFTPTTIPTAIASAEYVMQLSIENSYGTYTFQPTTDLPDGITLSPSGQIYGIPYNVGTTAFRVSATSNLNPDVVFEQGYAFTVQPSQWKIEEVDLGFAPITINDGTTVKFNVTAPNLVNPLAIVKMVARVGTDTIASVMVPLNNYTGTGQLKVTKSMLPEGVNEFSVYIVNGIGYIVATYGTVSFSTNQQ